MSRIRSLARRFGVGMAIVLLAAPQSTPGPLTVTVLPFESLSSDTADDWVGRGVAETPAVDL